MNQKIGNSCFKIMNIQSFISALLFFVNITFAQSDILEYKDKVYVDFIESVAFHQSGLKASYPIVELNNGSLSLSFDDIADSFYDYTYRIIHCDRDWNPSALSEIEYLDGFNNELIRDYDTSENTYVDYVNYQLRIPNKDVQWLISGNYLLVIEDEEGLPLLSRRFMVIDPKITIDAKMAKSGEVLYIDSYQGIDFKLNIENYEVMSPLEELTATILQNGRWNTATENIKPTSSTLGMVRFQKVGNHSFPGQKEFRNFDIRSLNTATKYVHSIDLLPNGTTALLELSKSRFHRNYLTEKDANGAFVLDNFDNPNASITGDYVKTIFTVKTMEIEDREVYVVGRFNDWSAREKFKLEYDHQRKLYTGEIYFKQGYYDYLLGSKGSDDELETILLEGNWYETENDYIILIYHRAFDRDYDQLVGIRYLNSTQN